MCIKITILSECIGVYDDIISIRCGKTEWKILALGLIPEILAAAVGTFVCQSLVDEAHQ